MSNPSIFFKKKIGILFLPSAGSEELSFDKLAAFRDGTRWCLHGKSGKGRHSGVHRGQIRSLNLHPVGTGG